MKSFLEEYGFTILSAIVVIIIIMMVSPVGRVISNSIVGVVNDFSSVTSIDTDIDKVLDLDNTSDPQQGWVDLQGPVVLTPTTFEYPSGIGIETYMEFTVHSYYLDGGKFNNRDYEAILQLDQNGDFYSAYCPGSSCSSVEEFNQYVATQYSESGGHWVQSGNGHPEYAYHYVLD